VQHVALDAATQGFKDALTEQLGDAVTFEEKNAQGDSNTCSTIINGFVSDNVDLILANATPALQAAQAGTNTIPSKGNSQAAGCQNRKCFFHGIFLPNLCIAHRHPLCCIALGGCPLRKAI